MPSARLKQEYVASLASRGFELEAVIGSGLSGTVVRARQASLQRTVAVKFFDNPFTLKNKALRKRFTREPLLLARAQHPGIPYVITSGEVASLQIPYLVMAYVPGECLRKVLAREKRLSVPVAVRHAIDVLDALQCAHTHQIVHRDVKPENILISDGRCVLIDFSIAVSREPTPGLTRATATGEHLGTDDYMCPEQRRSMGSVDHRCDLYAVGLVFFEMLTGTPRLILERLDSDLAHLPVGVREVVRRACADSANDRLPTATAFLDALRPFGLPGFMPASEARPALCTNVHCQGADWTPSGFYRGPRVLEPTIHTFCEACGKELTKHCAKCGAPYRSAQFCATCGSSWWERPTCKLCDSWLRSEDFGTDTETNCCSHGRTKGRWRARQGAIGTGDDDIPF